MEYAVDILRSVTDNTQRTTNRAVLLEAVRPKVPVIFEFERSGKASKEASSIEDRIELGYLPGTPTSTTNLPNRACTVNKATRPLLSGSDDYLFSFLFFSFLFYLGLRPSVIGPLYY